MAVAAAARHARPRRIARPRRCAPRSSTASCARASASTRRRGRSGRGVSLIPVREALRALAGEGLVTYRPRRGYAVTELDLAELEEIYRLRRLLETDALRRGVARATAADLARARGGRRRVRAQPPRRATSPGSWRRTGASTTGCTRSPAAAVGTADRPALGLDRGLPRPLLRPPGRGREADRAHRAIIAAVAAGDADAGGRAPGRAPRAGRSSASAARSATRRRGRQTRSGSARPDL